MTEPNSLVSAALGYAQRGWPVLPIHDTAAGACSCGIECDSPGKHPRTANGLKDALTSAAVIEAWWRRWPTANVAIATGALSVDVLDLDVLADGRTGWAAFRRIRDVGLATGGHTMVKTPRGGLHIYFVPSGNRNGSLPDHHIDCRGDGGYVLAPPSIVNGRPYELIESRHDATGVLRWAEIRSVLAPARSRPAQVSGVLVGQRSIGALARWLSGQEEGNRNSSLFWACNRALEGGAGDLGPLIEAAIAVGLTEHAAQLTAASAMATQARSAT